MILKLGLKKGINYNFKKVLKVHGYDLNMLICKLFLKQEKTTYSWKSRKIWFIIGERKQLYYVEV